MNPRPTSCSLNQCCAYSNTAMVMRCGWPHTPWPVLPGPGRDLSNRRTTGYVFELHLGEFADAFNQSDLQPFIHIPTAESTPGDSQLIRSSLLGGAGDRTSNLPVTSQPALPSELMLPQSLGHLPQLVSSSSSSSAYPGLGRGGSSSSRGLHTSLSRGHIDQRRRGDREAFPGQC